MIVEVYQSRSILCIQLLILSCLVLVKSLQIAPEQSNCAISEPTDITSMQRLPLVFLGHGGYVAVPI